MKFRRVLGVICLAMLMAVAGAKAEDIPVFWLATDMHYISPELTDRGAMFTQLVSQADGKVMLYSEELMEAFTEQAIRVHPDVLILSGDLTFNGAKQSHIDLVAKLRRIREAGVHVLVIPGNHDLDSRQAAHFIGSVYQRVSNLPAEEFAELYADFGYADALSRDDSSLSYVARPVEGWRFLMLDVNTKAAPCAVAPATLEWVERQLREARKAGDRVIAVSHQNLFKHNSLFYANFVIANADKLYALYRQNGVRLNLSGHMHMQHIAEAGGVTEIATSALSVSPLQYGVLQADGSQVRYETAIVDVAGWARGKGLSDPDLLDFDAYARRFFDQTTKSQMLERLKGRENAEEIAQFAADLNHLYFAGRTDLIDADSPLWDELPKDAFFTFYMSTFRRESRNATVCAVAYEEMGE